MSLVMLKRIWFEKWRPIYLRHNLKMEYYIPVQNLASCAVEPFFGWASKKWFMGCPWLNCTKFSKMKRTVKTFISFIHRPNSRYRRLFYVQCFQSGAVSAWQSCGRNHRPNFARWSEETSYRLLEKTCRIRKNKSNSVWNAFWMKLVYWSRRLVQRNESWKKRRRPKRFEKDLWWKSFQEMKANMVGCLFWCCAKYFKKRDIILFGRWVEVGWKVLRMICRSWKMRSGIMEAQIIAYLWMKRPRNCLDILVLVWRMEGGFWWVIFRTWRWREMEQISQNWNLSKVVEIYVSFDGIQSWLQPCCHSLEASFLIGMKKLHQREGVQLKDYAKKKRKVRGFIVFNLFLDKFVPL